MLKYFFSAFLVLLITFQSTLSSVFASTSDSDASNISVSTSQIISTGDNGGEVAQPLGWKSWIIKRAMNAIALALRTVTVDVLAFLRSIGAPAGVLNEIQKKAIPLAQTLDKIADDFDYYSATVKQVIIQQLQAQGYSFNIAYWVAQIVDFVSF